MREIVLTEAEFDALPEYSTSIPTGTTVGKRWKARRAGWWLGEYSRELPVPTCCRYHRCIAGVVDQHPCQPNLRTHEGVEYDPRNPEAWPERANKQIEIVWSKIRIAQVRQELEVHLL